MNDALRAARTVVSYLKVQSEFKIVPAPKCRHWHMGALIADATLQPGLNYKNVVLPRVRHIETIYSSYKFTSDFLQLAYKISPELILTWNCSVKPRIMMTVLFLLSHYKIEEPWQLAGWLTTEESLSLLSLNGIGPKTYDYLKLLSGASAVPVDRHFINFLNSLGVGRDADYSELRNILEFSADLMEIDRSTFDHSLCTLLSTKKLQYRLRKLT